MCRLDRSARAPTGELLNYRFCTEVGAPSTKALARPLGSEEGGAKESAMATSAAIALKSANGIEDGAKEPATATSAATALKSE